MQPDLNLHRPQWLLVLSKKKKKMNEFMLTKGWSGWEPNS